MPDLSPALISAKATLQVTEVLRKRVTDDLEHAFGDDEAELKRQCWRLESAIESLKQAIAQLQMAQPSTPQLMVSEAGYVQEKP